MRRHATVRRAGLLRVSRGHVHVASGRDSPSHARRPLRLFLGPGVRTGAPPTRTRSRYLLDQRERKQSLPASCASEPIFRSTHISMAAAPTKAAGEMPAEKNDDAGVRDMATHFGMPERAVHGVLAALHWLRRYREKTASALQTLSEAAASTAKTLRDTSAASRAALLAKSADIHKCPRRAFP